MRTLFILTLLVARSAWAIPVLSASNANPAALTTPAHSYVNNMKVSISGGAGNWAAINGTWTVTVSSATVFTIPVNTASFGPLTGKLQIKGTRPVCNSTSETLNGAFYNGYPCIYTTITAAVNAASPGDEVVLNAGQTFGAFRVKSGIRDMVIKSSRIDEWPRGFRIERDSPLLAKVVAPVSGTGFAIYVGDNEYTFNGTAGNPTLTSTITPVDWAIGDEVDVMGKDMSPYYCNAALDATYAAADCTPAHYDKWVFRQNMGVVDGEVLYVIGDGVDLSKTGLSPNQDYYSRDMVWDGTLFSFNLSATPGGPAIAPAADIPAMTGLMLAYAPYPYRQHQRMYVVAKSSVAPWTVQLSATKGGAAWNFPQMPTSNGRGLIVCRTNPGLPRNIIFDGLDVASSGTEPPYLIFMYPGFEPATAPTNIWFRRMWVHGYDDQTNGPVIGIRMTGYQSGVEDSIVEHMYSNSQDTQAVAIVDSPGDVTLTNNYLSATGMSVMSGGNISNYVGRAIERITVRRNHGTKLRKWMTGMTASLNGGVYSLRGAVNGGNNCATEFANSDSSRHCFWYFGDTRYEISQDTSFSLSSVTATGWAYLYGLADGTLALQHNLNNGTFNCPAHVACSYAPTPTVPAGSPRLARFTITAGAFVNNLADTRQVYHKNIFESKAGDKWLIEGNVMEKTSQTNTAIHQGVCINLTSAATDSGAVIVANYFVRTREVVIRNNICRNSGEGVLLIGKGYSSRKEVHGLTRAGNVLIENNLLYDIGSEFNTYTPYASAFRAQEFSQLTIRHNTVIDTRDIFYLEHASVGPKQGSYFKIEANVFTPWMAGLGLTAGRTALPGFFTTSADWVAITASPGGIDGPTSRFGRNLILNRNNVATKTLRGANWPDAPDKTYCVEVGDGCTTSIFSAFSVTGNSTNYAASNFRIVAPYSTYPTYTGRLIGADMDEIEALMGADGADVVAGRPPFSERSRRKVQAGSTSAVLSYLPLSSVVCTVSLWSSNTYRSGMVLDAVSDASAPIVGNQRVMQISGLTPGTRYYGKRWCGAEVDVFQFITGSTASETTIGLSGPAGSASVELEWGISAALGNTTASVGCPGGAACSVRVPALASHYRYKFRNASGSVMAVSSIRTRAAD